jgi:hypothetical protein
MKRNLIAAILLALALALAPASASAGAPAAPAAKPAKAVAVKPGVAKSGARLDEVHIKGEIPEPQVLFVVGRERRRFLDFQHRRYLAGRAALGANQAPWTRVVDRERPAAE